MVRISRDEAALGDARSSRRRAALWASNFTNSCEPRELPVHRTSIPTTSAEIPVEGCPISWTEQMVRDRIPPTVGGSGGRAELLREGQAQCWGRAFGQWGSPR